MVGVLGRVWRAIWSHPVALSGPDWNRPYVGPNDLDDYGNETEEMRRAYRDLHKTEPAFRAALEGKVAAVAATDVTVQPEEADDPADRRVAEFVKFAVDKSPGGWPGLIAHVAEPAFLDGWSANEIVLGPVTDSRKWAGLWGLADFRSLDSMYLRLKTDLYRQVTGVVSIARGLYELPREKFVLYSHADLFGNPFGTSVGRAVFRSANLIKSAYQLWHIALTYYSQPFLKGKYKDVQNKPALEQAMKLARAAGWISLPTTDDLEVVDLASATSYQAFERKVDKLRQEIFLAVRGAYLPFTEGMNTQARGNTAVNKKTGSDQLEYMACASIGQALTRQLVPALVRPNFGPRVGLPRIVLGGVDYSEMGQQLDIASRMLNEFRQPLGKKWLYRLANMEAPADPEDAIQPPAQPAPTPGATSPTAGIGLGFSADAEKKKVTLAFDPNEARDDHGQWVGDGEVDEAKADPAKAAQLRARVTDPEQRAKLDKQLAGARPPAAATSSGHPPETVDAVIGDWGGADALKGATNDQFNNFSKELGVGRREAKALVEQRAGLPPGTLSIVEKPVRDPSMDYASEFDVDDGAPWKFYAAKGGGTWHTMFEDPSGRIGQTGEQGAKAVTAVRQGFRSLDKFVEARSPEKFFYTAAAGEPSRVALYDRMSRDEAVRHGYALERTAGVGDDKKLTVEWHFTRKPADASPAFHSTAFSAAGILPIAGRHGDLAARHLAATAADGAEAFREVAATAIRRLAADPQWKRAKTLFTDGELTTLSKALMQTITSADLLGRARIADHAARVSGRRTFAEGDQNNPNAGLPTPPEVMQRLPDRIPALVPAEAVAYFKNLTPTLGVDPQRLLPTLQRRAFTLSVATEETLLNKVQDVITRALETGDRSAAVPGIQQLLDQAGVAPENPQYADMVFRTNALESMNTGAAEQLADLGDTFPVWQYLGIDDGRERETHLAQNDRYYANDVPFAAVRDAIKGEFDGFNCRCSFRPVDRYEWADLQAKGATLSEL